MKLLKLITILGIVETFLTAIPLTSDKVYAATSKNQDSNAEISDKKALNLPFDTTPLGRQQQAVKGQRLPTDIEMEFREQELQQFRDDYRVYNSSSARDQLRPLIPPVRKKF